MIIVKSPTEIEFMRKAGMVTARILEDLNHVVKPGITTGEIDAYVESEILKGGMIPAFKGYNDFPASACISVNEEVVHGIPGKRKLREGDIVSIDLGTIYHGYYSDAARTYPVGQVAEEAQRLIDVTKESFFEGIKFCKVGCRLTDISHAVQKHVEAAGFSVIRDFVGHGIGVNMHEDPQIPNYGAPNKGPRLVPGMVFAIEPMVNQGSYDVRVLPDRWTVVTQDGKWSAHYENTVAVTENGPDILTIES